MAAVSDRLREARERAGVTLEEISRITKIKVPALTAIERGEWERLPGTFFTRAFLRTYARELRLPAEEIVRLFDEDWAKNQPPPPFHPSLESPRFSLSRFHLPGGAAAVAAILLLVIIFLAERQRPSNEPAASESGAVATSGVAAAAIVPAVEAAAQEPARLSLDVRPSDAVWVVATADGQRVLYRLLQTGEQTRLDAHDEIVLRIGNAAAFSYSLNGKPGRILGGPGEVIDVRINRANYRSFFR